LSATRDDDEAFGVQAILSQAFGFETGGVQIGRVNLDVRTFVALGVCQ
jgi:hypothetical protein